MSLIKIITSVNWVLSGIYGVYVIYHLLQANGSTDAAGQGLESTVKGVFFFLLLLVVGLNLLPHLWTKIIALILGILLLLMIYYINTH